MKKSKDLKKYEPNKMLSTTGFNSQHELIITPMFSFVGAPKTESTPKEEVEELKTFKEWTHVINLEVSYHNLVYHLVFTL